MVIESLTNPAKAEQHPVTLLGVGFLYATVALFLSLWVFPEEASITMVLLVVYAALPLFYTTMRYEEKQLVHTNIEQGFLSHRRVLLFFLYFFIGLTAGFTVWYLILPASMSSPVFATQMQTISRINQHVTGGATSVAVFENIFLNNAKVLVFSLLLSFVFGSGALFILTWNASVIAAAAGSFTKMYLAVFLASGNNNVTAYAYAITLSVLRYAIHGIPEILAYFIAGLAGGILSAAIIRKDFSRHGDQIIRDCASLMGLAVFVLLVAGLLEVYVTPLVYHLV